MAQSPYGRCIDDQGQMLRWGAEASEDAAKLLPKSAPLRAASESKVELWATTKSLLAVWLSAELKQPRRVFLV